MEIYLPIAEQSMNVFVLLGLGGAAGLLAGQRHLFPRQRQAHPGCHQVGEHRDLVRLQHLLGLGESAPAEGIVEQPLMGVYRIDPDLSVTLAVTDAAKPNGVAVSPDQRTLYVGSTDSGSSICCRISPNPITGLLAVKVAALGLGLYCWRGGKLRLLGRMNLMFAAIVAWNLAALIVGTAA